MAIILRGKTKCALCDQIIADEGAGVRTAYIIVDSEDPLWRFSSPAIHRLCFQNWDMREDFVDYYNATTGSFTFPNGTYRHMQADGSISMLKRE